MNRFLLEEKAGIVIWAALLAVNFIIQVELSRPYRPRIGHHYYQTPIKHNAKISRREKWQFFSSAKK